MSDVASAAAPRGRVLADVRDARLLAAVMLHVAALLALPHAVVVGVLFWWCANTVAHNFIHNPFFRDRRLNAAFSVVLTVLLGVPQALWRARHLEHHAQDGRAARRVDLRRAPGLRRDTAAAVAWWLALLGVAPHAAVTVFAPGLAFGLALSYLQGVFEHLHGVTGHDGRVYNALFANDGLHPEHHVRPRVHWADLPRQPRAVAYRSHFPAVLRWLGEHPLDLLERLLFHAPWLRRAVLAAHERALTRVTAGALAARDVVVVGGGLYPRSAILLRRALPDAVITIVDRDAASLSAARRFAPKGVRFVQGCYDPDVHMADVVVLPLALVGARADLIRRSRCRAVLVHDWIWRRRADGAESVVVAWWLAKRLTLVARHAA